MSGIGSKVLTKAGRRSPVQAAARLYAQRRARDRTFGRLGALFRDPAWDIVLDLYVAESEGRSVSVSSAAIASGTPMSTGLRCIDAMVEDGLVRREPDPSGARRSFAVLTGEARGALELYLALIEEDGH